MLVILLLTILSAIGNSNNNILSTFFILMLFFGVPYFSYKIMQLKSINFVIDNDKLLINFGLILKQSVGIPFNAVQSVSATKGWSLGLFGLSKVNIWTGSNIQTSNNDKKANKPDGVLIILNDDAQWLQNYILSKGNAEPTINLIQNTPSV